MAEGWENWQTELLDGYILGYESFETQDELAEAIGKSLNAVKIKLSRRKGEIEKEEKRELTIEEYRFFLSNRFDKTSEEIAGFLNMSKYFLLEELDEIDCLESFEYFEDNYKERIISIDEIKIFSKLLDKNMNAFQIAHILNRPIEKITEMINNA